MICILAGVNGECVSGQCDCIRNGANQCVGSPPTPCNKQLEGDAACSHGQVCDARYDWCVCPSGSVILGERCVRTISATGGGYYFDSKIRLLKKIANFLRIFILF